MDDADEISDDTDEVVVTTLRENKLSIIHKLIAFFSWYHPFNPHLSFRVEYLCTFDPILLQSRENSVFLVHSALYGARRTQAIMDENGLL